MIEFSKTGPLSSEPAESIPLFIGVGGAGAAVIDQIQLLHEWAQGSVYTIDSDLGSIRSSVAKDKFLLGHDICHGLGGCSDPETIRDSTRRQQKEILDMLDERDWAVVICGLGGATGSGAVYDLVKMLNSRNSRVLVIAIMPFAFESKARRQTARETLERLEDVAELVLACENDRLTGTVNPEADFREGLHEMNAQLSRAVVDFSRILVSESAIQLDLADCRHSLGTETNRKLVEANCWISHAIDKSGDAESVVEQALDGIQFRDGEVWDLADGMIATIVGGRDLSMDRSQEIIRTLTGMVPDGMEVTTGALCDPDLQDSVRLTVVATRSLREKEVPKEEIPEAMDEGEPLSASVPEPDLEPELEPSGSVLGGESIDEASDDVVELPPMERFSGSTDIGEEQLQPLFDEDSLQHHPGTPQRYFSEQEELPLDSKEDRGWFEKTAPTTFNGQDLDRPTYQRLGMKIRL
jgi:cell division protein FtsZ